MKKITLIIFLIITTLSCTSSKIDSIKRNSVGVKKRTSNPNTPYIYKNGFKDFEIKQVLSINGKDSTYINELRFNAVFSAMYTKKLMFEKFGKWDKEVWTDDCRHPVLIWEKRNIFGDNGESYSIAANGVENKMEMYASVIIFDNNNQDCLTNNSPKKDYLITYFSNGIKNLSSSKKFSEAYWKVVK